MQSQIFVSFQDNYGYLRFSTNNGISRFDLENKTFTRLEDNLPRLRSYVSGEKLYAGTKSKMKFYRMEGEQLQSVLCPDLGDSDFYIKRNRQNDCFTILSKGSKLYIYRNMIEHDSLRFQFFFQSSDHIRCIERLDDHRFWFEEKLEYSVTVTPEVDTQKMIPNMVLQTFCENALKHGLRHKPDGGTIKINACNQGNYLVVSVEDNGIGREKARTMQTEGSKEGLKIVQQQLDICNKHNTKNACYLKAVDLFDKENQPAGTRFELHIPLKLNISGTPILSVY